MTIDFLVGDGGRVGFGLLRRLLRHNAKSPRPAHAAKERLPQQFRGSEAREVTSLVVKPEEHSAYRRVREGVTRSGTRPSLPAPSYV